MTEGSSEGPQTEHSISLRSAYMYHLDSSNARATSTPDCLTARSWYTLIDVDVDDEVMKPEVKPHSNMKSRPRKKSKERTREAPLSVKGKTSLSTIIAHLQRHNSHLSRHPLPMTFPLPSLFSRHQITEWAIPRSSHVDDNHNPRIRHARKRIHGATQHPNQHTTRKEGGEQHQIRNEDIICCLINKLTSTSPHIHADGRYDHSSVKVMLTFPPTSLSQLSCNTRV